MKKSKIYLISLAALLLIVIVWIVAGSGPEKETTVEVTVKSGRFDILVTTTGELEAKSSEKIMGPVNLRDFRIWQVKIEDIIPDGTVVDSSEYVATLDRTELVNKMKDEPTMTHFENLEGESWWWVHESNVKTTAIVLDTFLDIYGRFPYAEKIARWLTTATQQKRYLSTQEHIRLFMAFEKYFQVFEKETPNFVADVLFNKKSKVTQTFSGRELNTHTNAVYLKEYKPGKTVDVEFKKKGTGILYYLLRLKYYPIGAIPEVNRGFAVQKTYKTLDGRPIANNTFKAGEKYIVEINIDTAQERSFVMLDDPLPSGMMVLNPTFKTTDRLDREKSSRDSSWSGYWGNFYRSEIYFDRVIVFADYLTAGKHTWKYLVIAANPGDFDVPNTVVQEMYNPEVFGRNANRSIKIEH